MKTHSPPTASWELLATAISYIHHTSHDLNFLRLL